MSLWSILDKCGMKSQNSFLRSCQSRIMYIFQILVWTIKAIMQLQSEVYEARNKSQALHTIMCSTYTLLGKRFISLFHIPYFLNCIITPDDLCPVLPMSNKFIPWSRALLSDHHSRWLTIYVYMENISY